MLIIIQKLKHGFHLAVVWNFKLRVFSERLHVAMVIYGPIEKDHNLFTNHVGQFCDTCITTPRDN